MKTAELKERKVRSWGRYFGGATLGTLGFCTSWAVNHKSAGPEWIEVVEVDMYVPNLASQFRGLRIIHLSDLHYSRTVTGKYLRNCLKRVNQLDGDIVVLTGDYTTYDFNGKFREKVVDLLSGIKHRYGIYACLGNHDYGVCGIGRLLRNRQEDMLDQMIENVKRKGVNLLRNQADAVRIDGRELWLVGLGDLWADDFNPEKAFGNVPEDEAVIALVHNPEGVEHLEDYPVNAIMSGHTHGVSTNMSAWSGWKMKTRDFHAGLYDLGEKVFMSIEVWAGSAEHALTQGLRSPFALSAKQRQAIQAFRYIFLHLRSAPVL